MRKFKNKEAVPNLGTSGRANSKKRKRSAPNKEERNGSSLRKEKSGLSKLAGHVISGQRENPASDGEQIGYRKPPKKTRFQKGQSGNPKGRPRKKAGLKALLLEELQKKIPIVENGKPKKITFERAIAKQFKNKAAGGDMRAMAMLLKEDVQKDASEKAQSFEDALETFDHGKIVRDIVLRIRSMDATPEET